MDDYFYFENRITDLLDQLLEAARSGEYKFAPWAPIAGLTGSGKTASVKAWLKHNNIKSFYIDAPARAITQMEILVEKAHIFKECVRVVSSSELEDILGLKKEVVNVMFTSEEIDSIDNQTAIVIDNYSFASQEQRDELLKIIRRHTFVDPRSVTGKTVVNPMLLVVIIETAALLLNNPLTDAELDLFGLEEYKESFVG